MTEVTKPHDVQTEWEERADQLFHELRRVADALDNLWHLAYALRNAEIEIPLGDASQSLHRALVALSPLCSCDVDPKGGVHDQHDR